MWFKTIFRRKPRQSSGGWWPGRQNRPTSGGAAARFQPNEALLRRLERLSVEARRNLRGMPSSGEHPSRQQLPATIFDDHRPYTSGDDYRYVDWNAYARQDEIVVRMSDAEQAVDVHLLLDSSRSMGWGSPPKLVAAQHVTAALGYLALAHGDRLRVAPFGNAPLPPFGPALGKGRSLDMLRFVADVAPAPHTDLARALSLYARMHERGGLLVLCSDLLSESPEALLEGLRVLPQPRWQVLVLHLLDPRELQPDLNGPLELEDSETSQRLHLTLDAEALAQYRSNVAAWQEQIARTCAQRGVSYTQIQTDWPFERVVVPYLRVRQVLHNRHA
ncbi:MAG TPA: DUF58 domain-containing protein [Roseiflexaceae bacterium]|nr:DUF58 domain-containing protein [Roseiflexaceae bacterium]